MHILWLAAQLLHPVDKGGRIRTYHMLRELRRHNRVTYLTLDDGTAALDAVERASEYAHELIRVPFAAPVKGTPAFFRDLLRNAFSSAPYAVGRYRSADMLERVRTAVAELSPDVVVCDFLAPTLNVPRDLPAPTVLFQHNVEAMIWQRHYEVAQGVRKRYFGLQWRRMRRLERSECRRYDAVVAVSPQDARMFAADYGVAEVGDVPTGVDTSYFRPSGTEPRLPADMVFVGSMDWLPNEDGVAYFVEAMLPLVRRDVPEATLTIVGRTPSAAVRQLAERDPSVRVTGSVPDVRPFVERAAVFVVPLRIGGGTRLKIYEGMAMEKPVVSTTIGAEGLTVRDGENIVIADTPEAFAAAVVRLLRDPARAAALGQQAATDVRAALGWDQVARRFAELCERAIARRHGSPASDPDELSAVSSRLSALERA